MARQALRNVRDDPVAHFLYRFVHTPRRLRRNVGKAIADSVAAKAPIGRAGMPGDLWGAVVYLASDLSRYHTGDTLVIDGGKMISN